MFNKDHEKNKNINNKIIDYYNTFTNDYLLKLKWIYNSYFLYKVDNYINTNYESPYFFSLYEYLNKNIDIDINKLYYDKIDISNNNNHYKFTKYEQYIT
jgi:hypothetical protein